MNMRASGATEFRRKKEKKIAFSHSKNAIFSNISLVLQILCLRNMYFQVSKFHLHTLMQFSFIPYGIALHRVGQKECNKFDSEP